ncbi:MAG TPA: choice-of-anchor tandem repeat GloVer-containing protein [Rhizomicrobium sp.]|nr:choice-of-anchor tandem repeat GloVer-containing protein [Rhizomicrobium sp.]
MDFSIKHNNARVALAISVTFFAIVAMQGSPAHADAETVVHSFNGPTSDGALPSAGMIDTGHVLYGTTTQGGTGTTCSSGSGGCGTVFSWSPKSGAEAVLYSFQGGSTDGAVPYAGMIKVGGILYGTTTQGGTGTLCTNGCGTVFSVNLTTGVEAVVYSFQGGTDGAVPYGRLLNVGGKLFGTTTQGGTGTNCSNTTNGCGTVFYVNPTAGTEVVVYSFQGGIDGAIPYDGLIDVGHILYGTTTQGGTSTNCTNGCGTVFSVTKKGVESVLYSFSGGDNDGAFPVSGLLRLGDLLYGTTEYGGSGDCEYNGMTGCGVVYSITTAGNEIGLYSFQGVVQGDGAYPDAPLVNFYGTLYGTTSAGGDSECGVIGGCGTVYSITTAGTEQAEWSFEGGISDGVAPYAPLVKVGHALYGTTSLGGGPGCDDEGCGTVFKILPH